MDRVLTVCSVCATVNEIPQYSQLVLSVCETLQDEVIALFDQTRHSLTLGDATDDKDSMETDDASRVKHKDQRDGVRDLFVCFILLSSQRFHVCLEQLPLAARCLQQKFQQFLFQNYSLLLWHTSVWETGHCCLSYRSVLKIVVTIANTARKRAECNVRDTRCLNL